MANMGCDEVVQVLVAAATLSAHNSTLSPRQSRCRTQPLIPTVHVQAWLATRGRALRAAVTEQRLWGRALDALPAAGAAGADCKLAVDRRVAADYVEACQAVRGPAGCRSILNAMEETTA